MFSLISNGIYMYIAFNLFGKYLGEIQQINLQAISIHLVVSFPLHVNLVVHTGNSFTSLVAAPICFVIDTRVIDLLIPLLPPLLQPQL